MTQIHGAHLWALYQRQCPCALPTCPTAHQAVPEEASTSMELRIRVGNRPYAWYRLQDLSETFPWVGTLKISVPDG